VKRDLKYEVGEVSPEQARRWLARVRNKAKLDARTIAAYARDMSSNRWKLNGEPIILGKSGELLTGRLRLNACIQSGRPFPSLIIYDIDDRHYETIDALRRRTLGDILTIRREPDGRALAAALAVLWRYSNDDLVTARRRVTSSQLLQILQENPDIRTSLRLTRDVRKFVPHGAACALHFLFSQVNAEMASRFFQGVLDPVAESHPASGMLRRQMDDLLKRGGNRSQAFVVGLTIKAWEAFVADKPLSLLRFSLEKDEFPEITGLPSELGLDGLSRRPASRAKAQLKQGREGLQVRLEHITPERAEEILSHNDGNRRIASAVVDKYSRDIAAGAWVLNGQTIKIGRSGRLLDGQHRCAAAIRAQQGFDAIVVEGLDESVFDTFDLGTRRSIGDILIDKQETNTSTLAAALRQLWLLKKQLLQYRVVSPTVSELLDTLEEEPELRESVKFSNRVRDVTSPSLLCALHYLFSRIDKERADEFMARLSDGLHLDDTANPIWRLRKRLLDDRASKKRDMSDAERAAIVIKAWNAYVRGDPLLSLKWANAGPKKEEFPTIAGPKSMQGVPNAQQAA
jgi:hypothetical protein